MKAPQYALFMKDSMLRDFASAYAIIVLMQKISKVTNAIVIIVIIVIVIVLLDVYSGFYLTTRRKLEECVACCIGP